MESGQSLLRWALMELKPEQHETKTYIKMTDIDWHADKEVKTEEIHFCVFWKCFSLLKWGNTVSNGYKSYTFITILERKPNA